MALTDNLAGYWAFDESSGNAADSSGNGTTLTNNGTVTYSSAKINNGAVFSSGKYFTASDNANISTTGDTTWQVWWYPTTINAQNAFFDKWNYSTGNREYEIFANYSSPTTTIYANFSSNGSGAVTLSKTTTSISVNNWYHLVYVFTASTGTLEVYLNGTSLGTSSGAISSIYNGNSTLGIGRFINDGAGGPTGTLDELAMWKRALSSSEVTQLYNAGAGLAYPFSAGGATFLPKQTIII